MLEGFEFAATLPAQDIERAKTWYREKLGLEPVEEHEGALIAELGVERSAWFKDCQGNTVAIAQLARG